MAKKPRKSGKIILTVSAEANAYLELAEALDQVADCLRERLAHNWSASDAPIYWRYAVTANPRLKAVRRNQS